jgi:hypothetical protein
MPVWRRQKKPFLKKDLAARITNSKEGGKI